MKAVFIYCLKDPVTGDVRYIGQTNNLKKRFSAHIKTSVKQKTHLGSWLKSLSGKKPILAVLHEVSEGESWAEEERRYISCARALGMDLVNLTDGGDGPSGWVPTSETLAAMSAAWTAERRLAQSKARTGVPNSPEQNAAISAAQTGVPHSPKRRATQSARMTGVPLSPKHYAGMCAAARTPERRAARGAAMGVAHKGVPWSPARRAAYERRFGQAKNTL